MPNRMREPVGYTPFHPQPVLQDGRLTQPEFGGELLYRTSEVLARAAGVFGERARQEQQAAGDRAGMQAALSGAQPAQIEFTGAPDVSGDIGAVIDKAAATYGEDARTLRAIAQIESSGKPDAKNKDSGAAGLFQFVPSTAKAYGLTNPYDAAANADAAARLTRDNRGYLKRVLGRDPTPGELYLAHQQGMAGATRLLKNPDASAASIVGSKAVTQNGGTEGMTAREFATLWTRRLDGSASITARPGGFQPTRQATPFGEAFDRHAADYWQRLQVALDTNIGEIEQKFGDDPAKLAAAFGDLKKAYIANNVFPELQPDFETFFYRRTAPVLQDAGERLKKRQTEEEKGSWLAGVNQAEQERDRRVEGYTPGSAAAAADLARRQDEIDLQYDEAVRRGYMSPAQGVEAKASSRRATTVRFYVRQADPLTSPEDVAALRENMRTDYAAGKLPGIDAAGWENLDGRLAAMERTKRTDGNLADRALQARADDMAARVGAGGEVPQAEISKLITDAASAPNGQSIVEATQTRMRLARALRDKPLTEAEAEVAKARAALPPTASPEALRAVDAAAAQVRTMKEKAARDPLGLAAEQAILPSIAELDLSGAVDGTAVASQIAGRTVQASAIAEHYGVRPRYLRPGEAQALHQLIKTDPDKVADIVGGLVSGAGAAAPDVLAEIGQTSAPLQQAGLILVNGGNAEAMSDLVRGAASSIDGKPWKSLAAADRTSIADETFGEALVALPSDRARVAQSAGYIARYRMAEAGLAPDDPGARQVYERALQEAAGATYDGAEQWGGFGEIDRPGVWSGSYKVKVPPSVRADRFGDVLDAIKDQDLPARPVGPQGEPVSWSDLKAGTPIAVDGGYVFAVGSKESGDARLYRNQDGTPFVLDLEALLPRLAPRLSGAIRGQ